MDVVLLSRLQFALTVMFHYIFPPLTIGLGLLLVVMEGMFLKTKDPQYETMAKFWTKLFAVNFAMGVATGIVMEFQFGTNWSTYSRFVGDVFGSALAAEGVFAFFLESGFLAVLVFGWDRVSPKMHFFSTVMVSLGSMFSAIWIIVANSWQQTPAGFHIVSESGMARAEITDFWAVVFSPSSMHRLLHSLLGAYIMGGFFVMSIAAFYILRNRHTDFARKSFRIALVFAAAAAVAELVSGHFQADKVAVTQPPKLAAFEGHFETGPADLHLFGIPDTETGTVKMGLAIPGGLSFLVHGSFSAPVTGLDQFPRDEWPPVNLTFQTYHLMVALGMFFIGITVLGLFLLRGDRLFRTRWLLWTFVFAVLGPVIANQVGWATAELGRQPWVVYGLLKTSDGVSPSVGAGEVLTSIVMFGLIYLALLAVWIMVLDHKIKEGPEEAHEPGAPPRPGLLEAAAALAEPGGESMTEARHGGEGR